MGSFDLNNNDDANVSLNGSVLEDIELFHSDVGGGDDDDDDEEDDSIALRVKRRKTIESTSIIEVNSSEAEYKCEVEPVQSVKPSDSFIYKISRVIKLCSPSSIFNPSKSRKRKLKMMKKIHPELQSLWRNSTQLFTGQSLHTEPCSP